MEFTKQSLNHLESDLIKTLDSVWNASKFIRVEGLNHVNLSKLNKAMLTKLVETLFKLTNESTYRSLQIRTDRHSTLKSERITIRIQQQLIGSQQKQMEK